MRIPVLTLFFSLSFLLFIWQSVYHLLVSSFSNDNSSDEASCQTLIASCQSQTLIDRRYDFSPIHFNREPKISCSY